MDLTGQIGGKDQCAGSQNRLSESAPRPSSIAGADCPNRPNWPIFPAIAVPSDFGEGRMGFLLSSNAVA
jgi:hypothetical protein